MNDASRAMPALTRGTKAAPGRLSVMALMGLFAGAVPMPVVPSAVLRRIRGALAHDIAARHGLCLTTEARKEISQPSRRVRNGALLATLAFVASRTLRRFGMLGVVPPLAAWIEVYALGLLFDRYLERVRSSQTLRIHGAEAKLVRRAIDGAVSRALSPKLELKPQHGTLEPTEELRDMPTRFLDGVLLAAAAVPDHLQRRLEAAFDAELDEEPLHAV
jgi:hypothetical protein